MLNDSCLFAHKRTGRKNHKLVQCRDCQILNENVCESLLSEVYHEFRDCSFYTPVSEYTYTKTLFIRPRNAEDGERGCD